MRLIIFLQFSFSAHALESKISTNSSEKSQISQEKGVWEIADFVTDAFGNASKFAGDLHKNFSEKLEKDAQIREKNRQEFYEKAVNSSKYPTVDFANNLSNIAEEKVNLAWENHQKHQENITKKREQTKKMIMDKASNFSILAQDLTQNFTEKMWETAQNSAKQREEDAKTRAENRQKMVEFGGDLTAKTLKNIQNLSISAKDKLGQEISDMDARHKKRTADFFNKTQEGKVFKILVKFFLVLVIFNFGNTEK